MLMILCNVQKKPNNCVDVGGVSTCSRNGAPPGKMCMGDGQMTKASKKLVPSPPPATSFRAQ